MAIKKKRPVAPLYLTAGVWLFFALFLRLYTLSDYISAGIASLVVFVVASAIFPVKVFTLPDPEPAKADSAPETDAKPGEAETDPKITTLLRERDLAVEEMRRLNDAIEDAAISAQITKLESLTARIMDHVAQHPEKLPQIRKFMNYYLPTTIKLLNAYDRMGSAGVSGEHIGGTMEQIESMLTTIVQSFEKQLDSLFEGEAMDISSDIKVLENLLAQEGLGSTQL